MAVMISVISKKKKKKKLCLVEHKYCYREFVFHLSNMHPTRFHEENDKLLYLHLLGLGV